MIRVTVSKTQGPVKYAEAFKRLGLTTPAGVLLCGPPGYLVDHCNFSWSLKWRNESLTYFCIL